MELEQTAFAQRVFALVKQIPPGRVATYGQLALLLGNPNWARRVGRALSHCGEEGTPCHRVVNCQGRPAPGWPEQIALLRREGVWDEEQGRVNLRRFSWHPFRE